MLSVEQYIRKEKKNHMNTYLISYSIRGSTQGEPAAAEYSIVKSVSRPLSYFFLFDGRTV